MFASVLRFLLILLTLSGAPLSWADAEEVKELGRLLTSPDERTRIDNIRSSKSQLGVDKSLTYRGTVLRMGRDWIWLNDQVLDAQGDAALSLNADHSLNITVGDKQYRLFPGQTLVPSQGLVDDPLKHGHLSIRY